MQSNLRHQAVHVRRLRRISSGIRALAGAVGVFTALLFSAASAAVIPLSIEELAAHSDDVVVGKVAPEQEVIVALGRIYTHSRFVVDESLKGTRQTGEEIDIFMPGGEIDGIGMMAVGLPSLKPEESIVLFLDRPTSERMAMASSATGAPADHPVLNTPRIVGGPQGKFTVVSLTETETDRTANRRATREVTRVMREVPGRRLSNQQYPTLDEFRAAIKRLSSDEVPVRARVQVVPGHRPVDVPERDPDAHALRVFDPFSAPAGTKREAPALVTRERLDNSTTEEGNQRRPAGPELP